nr:hypothetical protein [Tanacetum cinerariifolium]
MPIESNEPPDSLFDKMTSTDNIVHSSLNGNNDKAVKFKNRKPHKGIKVSTPGSAGAGSVLRRADEYLGDNRGGKCAAMSSMNDDISKVLSDLRSGSFDSNLKFSMGYSVDPIRKFCLNEQCSLVAKSCGPMTSPDHTGMGDVGNTSCGLASSKDGIIIAETGIVCDKEIVGFGTGSEHTNMEDVVSISVGQTSSQDGIASDKGGSGFVFGKNVSSAGVLKKPIRPVFNVQFSNIVKSNPFGRFAEKLKQGSDEMALKMEFTPNSVIKQENRKRRIEFTSEDIVKGGQAYSM